MITAWVYCSATFQYPELTAQGKKGIAYVQVEKVGLQHTFFGLRWVYQCQIKQFYSMGEGEQTLARNLPCKISFPANQMSAGSLPSPQCDYWVEGRLIKKDNGSYHLKVPSKTPWHRVEGSYSLASYRYEWKQSLTAWIHEKFTDSSTADFIAGLATGEFSSSTMRQQFSRFGLQHLLAISGFHFAITASFLNALLNLMLPMRIKNMILLFFLAGYSFFLGPYPSVLRAWMMCSLSIAGQLIDKKTTALNSLGIALLCILAYNPLLSLEISFKLSFGITAAILLFYQPVSSIFDEIIPKRRLEEVLQMNRLNQHAYCLLTFLRGGFALTVAVNLLAIPFSLYYFDKFPWMSLLFNLFIPFLASGSICLFLLSGTLCFLPWVSSAIMQLNEVYSSFLLKLLYHTPANVDAYLTVHELPHEGMLIYVSLILALGIWVKEQNSRNDRQFQFL